MADERKRCEASHCERVFTRGPNESAGRWNVRRFCSRSCSNRTNPHGRPRLPRAEYRSRYRVEEHRAVAAEILGRPLRPGEQVHHRNGDRLDNRPENLEVVTAKEHGTRHAKHPYEKDCVICERQFTPHPTKRARQQTCGRDECKRKLISLRLLKRNAA